MPKNPTWLINIANGLPIDEPFTIEYFMNMTRLKHESSRCRLTRLSRAGYIESTGRGAKRRWVMSRKGKAMMLRRWREIRKVKCKPQKPKPRYIDVYKHYSEQEMLLKNAGFI